MVRRRVLEEVGIPIIGIMVFLALIKIISKDLHTGGFPLEFFFSILFGFMILATIVKVMEIFKRL